MVVAVVKRPCTPERLADAVEAWLALHALPKGVEEAAGKKAYHALLDALAEVRKCYPK